MNKTKDRDEWDGLMVHTKKIHNECHNNPKIK